MESDAVPQDTKEWRTHCGMNRADIVVLVVAVMVLVYAAVTAMLQGVPMSVETPARAETQVTVDHR